MFSQINALQQQNTLKEKGLTSCNGLLLETAFNDWSDVS